MAINPTVFICKIRRLKKQIQKGIQTALKMLYILFGRILKIFAVELLGKK